MKTKIPLVTLTLALLTISAATVLLVGPAGIMASSHREAPITALDPMADITDLWAFRSYDVERQRYQSREYHDDHGSQSLRGARQWPQLVSLRSPDPLYNPR